MDKLSVAVMLLVLGEFFRLLRDRREQREREKREWKEERRNRWRK